MARLKSIDLGGQVLFLFGFGLIILGLTWGGATYPWASAAVIVSLVLGAIMLAAFFYWENLFADGNLLFEKWPWQRPMMPWDMITNRDIGLLFYTEVGNGIGMFAVSHPPPFPLGDSRADCLGSVLLQHFLHFRKGLSRR